MPRHMDKTDMLKYAAGMLSGDKRAEMEEHIAECNVCLLKVTHTINIKREACARARAFFDGYNNNKLDAGSMGFMEKHLLICNDCAGKYHNFLEEKEKPAVDIIIRDFYDFLYQKGSSPDKRLEVTQKGVNIGMNDRNGNIMVHLQSEKYDVSGVTVSLGKKTRSGFDAFLSAVTTSKGAAKLGKIKSMPFEKEKSKYSLHVSGLKKKIK